MREYELTVLIHPDLEADIEPALRKVRDIVVNNNGKIIQEDNWGKKRLAYPIVKENYAIYVYFEIELPPQDNAKVQSTLNITDEVIRYLLVSVDEKARAIKAEEAAEKNEVKEEE